MDVEGALLQAIHDSPNDETNWLVLADWLEEPGDPRGELLRLTLALRGNPGGAEAPAQEARLQALLASGVRPCVPVFTNSIGMQFALIRAGTVFLGSPDDERERHLDEGPQHEVEITAPFYLGVFAVTQGQYEKVMGSNPSYFSSTGDGKDAVNGLDTRSFPVECVSWQDAATFCLKLSKTSKEQHGSRASRLPTEVEWEHACRGGGISKPSPPFHFGASLGSTQANFNGDFPYGGTATGPSLGRPCPVGSYPPNAYGLYDMHGNVWEWCADWFDATYYRQSPPHNPQGPQGGRYRVARGGAWNCWGEYCRTAHRRNTEPGFRGYGVGFRVLLSM